MKALKNIGVALALATGLTALGVWAITALAQEPVPIEVYSFQATTAVVILDKTAFTNRCDYILQDRYKLTAAERREKIYANGEVNSQYCVEMILIDVLDKAHASLDIDAKTGITIQRQ